MMYYLVKSSKTQQSLLIHTADLATVVCLCFNFESFLLV